MVDKDCGRRVIALDDGRAGPRTSGAVGYGPRSGLASSSCCSEAVRSLFANVSTTRRGDDDRPDRDVPTRLPVSGSRTWAFSLSKPTTSTSSSSRSTSTTESPTTARRSTAFEPSWAANPLVKSVDAGHGRRGAWRRLAEEEPPSSSRARTLPYNPLGPALTVQPKAAGRTPSKIGRKRCNRGHPGRARRQLRQEDGPQSC